MTVPTEPATPPAADGEGHVVVRVRRTVLYGAAGMVVGFVLGIASAGWLRPAPAAPPLPPVPLAAAMPAAAPVPPPAGDAGPKPGDIAGRPVRGPADAPVTIVEFTDYECPFCRDYFANTLPVLTKQYGARLRYVVMNYPLESLHPRARAAAQAAECAADQGHFWEYHDALFRAPSLTRGSLRRMAARVGIDSATFATCLDSGARNALVDQHSALGTSLGVTGTPTFFINGRVLEGSQPLPIVLKAIDDALKAAGSK